MIRKKHKRTTKVFAKARLDNVTSAICCYEKGFGLTFINLAFVLNEKKWNTKI